MKLSLHIRQACSVVILLTSCELLKWLLANATSDPVLKRECLLGGAAMFIPVAGVTT